MEKLLRQWLENAADTEEANFRFLKWTKLISGSRVDSLAKEAHVQVFEKIDCTQCTNCCRTLKPEFSKADIARISKHLGQSKADFARDFLEQDTTGKMLMNRLPCAFLSDTGHCSIYELRPTACRDYPNTHKSGFSGRSYAHSANSVTCPAVYHILELMKYRLNYRDRGR